MIRLALFWVVLISAALAADAASPRSKDISFDPLDCRWTFGNHEPLAMYRRTGGPSTGGVEGSALWLEDWHRWFDSEACPQTMHELGLNTLHCRFYKGMGWQYESQDFPNVQRFVANCHKHGIRALAYVQFSTLYYEVMLNEIPDLADWAAVDENGRKRTYHGSYFRWLPCINAPGFEPYLARMVRIALSEGGFDGIMFDNCDAPACYCPRCVRLFREYLAKQADLEKRFGIPTADHVLPPVIAKSGEIRDPIAQHWIQFRCQRLTELFRRLYRAGKTCKPSAIMAGNVANIRRAGMAAGAALSVTDLAECFDIFVSQSGNEPGLRDGCVVNRVREMKLAQALETHILALSDSDAGISPDAEAKYVLNLLENAVFGGIPTDRTVMKANPQMVSRELVKSRKPLLRRFDALVRSGRAGLKRPGYSPVRLLYSRESVMFSEQAHRALLIAEEILLRNHVPYGLLPTAAETPLDIPADCNVLLVCDQKCLSDAQLRALRQFSSNGGRLVLTGSSGLHDEWYRQRKANPMDGLADRSNVVRRGKADAAPIHGSGWTIKVGAPADGGRQLIADIGSLETSAIRITAPPTVFAEIKRDAKHISVHLLNYASLPITKGVCIELATGGQGPERCSFATPMENDAATRLVARPDGKTGWRLETPAFSDYALVELSLSK